MDLINRPRATPHPHPAKTPRVLIVIASSSLRNYCCCEKRLNLNLSPSLHLPPASSLTCATIVGTPRAWSRPIQRRW